MLSTTVYHSWNRRANVLVCIDDINKSQSTNLTNALDGKSQLAIGAIGIVLLDCTCTPEVNEARKLAWALIGCKPQRAVENGGQRVDDDPNVSWAHQRHGST